VSLDQRFFEGQAKEHLCANHCGAEESLGAGRDERVTTSKKKRREVGIRTLKIKKLLGSRAFLDLMKYY